MTVDKIKNWEQAVSVEEDAFTRVDFYIYPLDAKGRLNKNFTSGPFSRSSTQVNPRQFAYAEVRRYPYPHRLRDREAAIWCAEHGVPLDLTCIFDKGHRAGCRDGYASEREEDGSYVAVKYEAAGYADGRYPYGTRRRVIWPE